ncbi:MAG: hypothetical protein A2096_10225 [Spirochaetes bacterium GWF1_41_5]|nr:MAG: hypothetical protein A2096_10225 [Spirochaetes bacterium GWF1_41_5]HBE03229.1 hypothetical protein [Spirochaetia bacterium]
MFLDLEKVVDYKDNRYELVRACMDYAEKTKIVNPDDYIKSGEKPALIAINDILNGRIKFTAIPEEDLESYDDDELSAVPAEEEI